MRLPFLNIAFVAASHSRQSRAVLSSSTIMSPTKTIDSILVVIAMEAEAKPFVEYLGLKETTDYFPEQVPFCAFVGEYEGCKVTVATNGKDSVYKTGVDNAGTVPASLVTFLALQKNPTTDLVLNAGTCGGFKRMGGEIGNVYLTSAVANHDRRIPIPPFIPYGIGKLESTATPALLAAHPDYFKTGVCTTGNSLDKTDEDDKHMIANEASCKDMEAAAIAWSCNLFDVPYLGIKVVTDIVDGDKPTQEEFMENLGKAAKSLQEALPKVIAHVCGKTIGEL